jgi:uncharacterized protein (TIGR02145 family)
MINFKNRVFITVQFTLLLFLIGCEKPKLEQLKQSPEVQTTLTIAPSLNEATVEGKIISDGGTSLDKCGICWGANSNPTILTDSFKTINSNIGVVSFKLDKLIDNTQYHVRIFASNKWGISYSSDVVFKTLNGPQLLTDDVKSITNTSAETGGEITQKGDSPILDCGVCWGLSHNPTIDLLTKTKDTPVSGKFKSVLINLSPCSIYYVRAYATTSIGTSYGPEVTFSTLGGIPSGTITDVDGNKYQTIKLGNQIWMAENLRTTHYRSGDPITTTIPDTKDINSEDNPKYQWALNGDESKVDKYGRFYTWDAAVDTRNIAPLGWHLPTESDFDQLEDYLRYSGYSQYSWKGYQIGKSMSANVEWLYDKYEGNVGCLASKNNQSNFNALPVGYRNDNSEFHAFSFAALFWCSDERNSTDAFSRELCADLSYLYHCYSPKKMGCSIRCVKDDDTNSIQNIKQKSQAVKPVR